MNCIPNASILRRASDTATHRSQVGTSSLSAVTLSRTERGSRMVGGSQASEGVQGRYLPPPIPHPGLNDATLANKFDILSLNFEELFQRLWKPILN